MLSDRHFTKMDLLTVNVSLPLGVLLMLLTESARGQLQVSVNGNETSASAALDQLRGHAVYSGADLRSLLLSAQPGTSYPTLSAIPQTSFSCDNVQQAGFYADPEAQCQVYHRCDPTLPMSSYLCPNGTLFSSIALTCDFWYNVKCSQSAQFDNYSNPRIYSGPNSKLLYDSSDTGNAV